MLTGNPNGDVSLSPSSFQGRSRGQVFAARLSGTLVLAVLIFVSFVRLRSKRVTSRGGEGIFTS